MAEPTVMSSSRTYPIAVEQAYDDLLVLPLPQLFDRWYGPLPPIREVTDAPPQWREVGQTRRIRLADRGSMRETLTVVEPPQRFGYLLDELTGPIALLVGGVDGQWSFDPAGTGVRVTWSWSVHPASRAGGAALPGLARLWAGYARGALQRVEDVLLPAGA